MEDYRKGRLLEAQAGFRQALEIAQAHGDRRGEAWALQNLAWVSTTIGDFEDAEETLRLAMKTIDKAAAKGVIHKNEASRRKSRLQKKAAQAEA